MEQYLKYVNSLGFETRPDYSHCRKLLRQGIKDSHFVDDGKLVFGANPKVPLTKKLGVHDTLARGKLSLKVPHEMSSNAGSETFILSRPPSILVTCLFPQRPMKRKSAEEPENICEVKPRKMSRNVLRQPCVAHNFNRRIQQVSEDTGKHRPPWLPANVRQTSELQPSGWQHHCSVV
uniref:Uncharacterized protein n=1 Tax=Timema douglasi TaxID=61478 RepID=A0A7R8ZJ58_TIMDO|nr:unnamed protein product [Timema douglasi]